MFKIEDNMLKVLFGGGSLKIQPMKVVHFSLNELETMPVGKSFITDRISLNELSEYFPHDTFNVENVHELIKTILDGKVYTTPFKNWKFYEISYS